MDKKDYSWREFHKHRKIIIKDIPPVTYKDVRDFLGTVQASDIIISKRLKHVIIALTHGHQAEHVASTLSRRLLLGRAVTVTLYPRRMMLCVLGVPGHVDDAQFKAFAEQFGPIEICFVVRTSSGISKGYGMIEYAHNRITTDRVRAQIASSCFPGVAAHRQLHCDYLPESVLHYEDLHSTTVVTFDPPSTAELFADLRRTACPHAVQEGASSDGRQRFLLIEFAAAGDAEKAWESCVGGLRFAFAMPGHGVSDAVRVFSAPQMGRSPSGSLRSATPRTSGRNVASAAVQRFRMLYPGKAELIGAFEDFLVKFMQSLNGEPLTEQAVENIFSLVTKPEAASVASSSQSWQQPGPRGKGAGIACSLSCPVLAPVMQNDAQLVPQRALRRCQPIETLPATKVVAGSGATITRSQARRSKENNDDGCIMQSFTASLQAFTTVQPDAEAAKLLSPRRVTPGYDYGCQMSLSGPMTRSRRRSVSRAAALCTLSSPYGRPFDDSCEQPVASGERSLLFEASMDDTLCYILSEKSRSNMLTPHILRMATRLLPDPEPSPDGHYVGQHSQGIGGHYADSYISSIASQHAGGSRSSTSAFVSCPSGHSSAVGSARLIGSKSAVTTAAVTELAQRLLY